MAKIVSFDCSADERELAMKIAERACRLRPSIHTTQLDHSMDLIAVHANGCPMDFEKLLAADDFNLAHDVFGIERHLDRETGELRDFFLPRCAAKERAAA